MAPKKKENFLNLKNKIFAKKKFLGGKIQII